MKNLARILVLLSLIFIMLACSHVERREYYPDGQLKSEAIKDGAIDWSNNKTIAPHFSGMRL